MCLLSVFSAAVSLVGVSHPFIVSRSKEIAEGCASLISCIGAFIGALGSRLWVTWLGLHTTRRTEPCFPIRCGQCDSTGIESCAGRCPPVLAWNSVYATSGSLLTQLGICGERVMGEYGYGLMERLSGTLFIISCKADCRYGKAMGN